LRKLLLASLMSLATIGMSGCVLVGPGNIYLKHGDSIVGEIHAQSGGLNGYLVTLYAGPTEAIRAFHDGQIRLPDGHRPPHTWNCAAATYDRDVCVLRWLDTFDGSAEWERATADEEEGDFHSALTGIPHRRYDCLAVHIDTPGWGDDENWTYRHASDSSCTPPSGGGGGSW